MRLHPSLLFLALAVGTVVPGLAAAADAKYDGFLCCNMRSDGSWFSDSNYAENGKRVIPAGTPVNLLANFNPDTDVSKLAGIFLRIKKAVAEIKLRNLDSHAARELMQRDVAPALFAASKCPDLITDRGHEFGSELPDADKRALIEYIKTF